MAFARQAFNDAVMSYNTQVERFPASIIAGIGGFARRSFSSWNPPKNERLRESHFEANAARAQSRSSCAVAWRVHSEAAEDGFL